MSTASYNEVSLSQAVYSHLAQGIAPSVLESEFLVNGSYAVIDDFWELRVHAALLQEADSRYPSAVDGVVTRINDEELRGGEPERRFLSASGGDVLHWAYSAPATAAALRGYTGLNLTPTGAMGTYSYYCRSGDHLGLHRDVVGCDLALITCLEDSHSQRPQGGSRLWLYPERWCEPLSNIRRNPDEGMIVLRLAPRQTLLFLGGLVPHLIDACAPGQRRVVAILCFRAT